MMKSNELPRLLNEIFNWEKKKQNVWSKCNDVWTDVFVIECLRREIQRNIRREHQRVEYLAGSKEFNASRCIRCFKPFKFLLNPREICSQCQLYVCHECARYERKEKIWICQLCEQLKSCIEMYYEEGTEFRFLEIGKIERPHGFMSKLEGNINDVAVRKSFENCTNKTKRCVGIFQWNRFIC